jgi:hypothetical protein
MKSLSDYTQDAISDLYKRTGAFWAFSQEQFNEQKQDGVKYIQLPSGCFVPEDSVKNFLREQRQIITRGIEQDLAERGMIAIVLAVLDNHEYSYTGDPSDTIDALEEYGITAEEVISIANGNYPEDRFERISDDLRTSPEQQTNHFSPG